MDTGLQISIETLTSPLQALGLWRIKAAFNRKSTKLNLCALVFGDNTP